MAEYVAGFEPVTTPGLGARAATAAGQFAQRANEGLIGALGFPFASKEFVEAYRQVAPPIEGAEESGAGRIGQFVGQSAAMAAPAFGAARAAQAIKNTYGVVTEFGAPVALRLMDFIGKAMGNVGGAKTPLQVAGREATAAVMGGAGGVAATEVFPDSKIAELGGQLIGALGPEVALKGVQALHRQVGGGLGGIGPVSRAGGTAHVGKELAAAVPPGTAAEAGLEEAVALQHRTGLAAPVAQATQAPGMQALESRVLSAAPSMAARAETRRAGIAETLRERVASTPGAEGETVAGQAAAQRSLEGERAAAQAPVADARALHEQSVTQFAQTAADVEQKMQAAVTKASADADQVAASLRPTATMEEVSEAIRTTLVAPMKATVKAEADRLYALVDPTDATVLRTGRIEAALTEARTQQSDALVEALPTLDLLEKRLAAVKKGGTETAPFNVVRRWESALGQAIEKARVDNEPNVARLLTGVKESVGDTLDEVMTTGAPDVAERYAAAKSFWTQYSERFTEGIVAKVMQRGAVDEGFKVAAEDVGREFFKGPTAKGNITSLEQYFNAVGAEPGARQAIRDVALNDFFETAYRTADRTMDPAKAAGWVRDHRRQLDELARAGVDLRPELTQAIQKRQSVDQLREVAAEGQKRLARGFLPQGGNPVAMAEQHATLAERASARTLNEIDQSAAAKYVNADPNVAGKVLLADTKTVEDVMRAAKGDAAAQRGIRRSMLDQALASTKGTQAVATGNPVFDTVAFGTFLDRHAGPLRAAFGEDGMAYLHEQHRIAQQLFSSQAARVSPRGMTEATGIEALYSYRELFGRAYQGAKGFASYTFLVGEAFARRVTQTLNKFSNEELRTIYERSLYDPAFANDLRMMTRPGFMPEVVAQKLRTHLGPTLVTPAVTGVQGELERPVGPGPAMLGVTPQAPTPMR